MRGGGNDKSYYLSPFKYRIQSNTKNHAFYRNIRTEKVKMYHRWRKYVSLRTQRGTLKNCFRDEQYTSLGELPSQEAVISRGCTSEGTTLARGKSKWYETSGSSVGLEIQVYAKV